MPCEGSRDHGAGELREACTKLTRLLSFCCDILDRRAGGQEIYEDNELRAWWAEHKELDRRRRVDEVERAGVKAAKLLTARAIREHGITLHAVDGDADQALVQQYLDQVAKNVADQLTREARE